jgi:hypothetical protein
MFLMCRYLTEEDDIKVLAAGFKVAKSIATSNAFRSLGENYRIPKNICQKTTHMYTLSANEGLHVKLLAAMQKKQAQADAIQHFSAIENFHMLCYG